MDPEWGRWPWIIQKGKCNSQGPIICLSVTEEAEVRQRDRDLRCSATIFEDGGGVKRPGIQMAYRSWKGKEHRPADTLISGFPPTNYKRRNVCCLIL